MKTTKAVQKDITKRLSSGEVIYLYDECDTDAGYMVTGNKAIVKYPGKAPFEISTSETSVLNAIFCGREITAEQWEALP